MQAQQHEFNMPYQLASPELHEDTDYAEDAEVFELDLQVGDVVVMATDGITDNLWDADFEKLVSAHMKVSARCAALLQALLYSVDSLQTPIMLLLRQYLGFAGLHFVLHQVRGGHDTHGSIDKP